MVQKSIYTRNPPCKWQKKRLEKPRECAKLAGFGVTWRPEIEGEMFFRMVLFFWEFVLDVAAVCRLTEGEKDMEILLLRQQLGIVERKQERGPQIARWQKVPLVALVLRLKQKASHFVVSSPESLPLSQ